MKEDFEQAKTREEAECLTYDLEKHYRYLEYQPL